MRASAVERDQRRAARDVRRAERWLTRTGEPDYLSPEAFDVLKRRLRAHWRARWLSSPVFVIAMALFVSGLWGFPDHRADQWLRQHLIRFLLANCVLAAASVLTVELGRRADARIAETLPTRVNRPQPVPVWWMFGWVRLGVLIFTVTVETTLAIMLAFTAPGWLAWSFAIALAGTGALAGLGVLRTATQPSVAMDYPSLFLDERLRSEDAFTSTSMLYLLMFSVPAASMLDRLPFWLSGVWMFSISAVQFSWLIAQGRPPWKLTPGRYRAWLRRLRPVRPSS